MLPWGEVVTSAGLGLIDSGFFIRAAMEKSETAGDSLLPSSALVSVPSGLDLKSSFGRLLSEERICSRIESACTLNNQIVDTNHSRVYHEDA